MSELSQLRRIRKLERELAECRAASVPHVLAYHGLVLDRMARVVTYKGDPLSLSPTEFAVLEYLLLHAGQTVTREDLIRTVWRGKEVTKNTTAVSFARLRKKLDPELAALISNVRVESGYTISEEEQ